MGLALKEKDKHRQVTGIAYTYNEPTVFLEFVLDCAREAKYAGLRTSL